MLIGLGALVLYPAIEAKNIIPHMIQELLPVGAKGMAMAGLLAISISSIDSFLHAAGLTFMHDVIKPFTDQKNININELKWVRYITLFISLAAITIGLNTTNTFGLLLNSLEFTEPALMFPLLSGIMGLKTDKRSFYTAMFITTGAFITSKLLLPPAQEHFTILISIAANGISFLGMHIIQNKGLAIVRRTQGKEVLWRPRRKDILGTLRH